MASWKLDTSTVNSELLNEKLINIEFRRNIYDLSRKSAMILPHLNSKLSRSLVGPQVVAHLIP